MKEIILPNVGKFAVIRRNPGQDRLRCCRKSRVRPMDTKTATLVFSDLVRNPSFQPGVRRGWQSLVQLKRGSEVRR